MFFMNETVEIMQLLPSSGALSHHCIMPSQKNLKKNQNFFQKEEGVSQATANINTLSSAGMAELADALDSGSSEG